MAMKSYAFPPLDTTTPEWPLTSTAKDFSSTNMTPLAERPSNTSRAASFRRALSFSNNRMSSDIPRPPALPFSPVSPPLLHRKSFSLPKRSSVPAPLPVHARTPSLYYNDPDARRKLKQYLASPQNFEEALEFGFPSTSKPVASTAPQLPAFSDNDVHAFLRDSSFWDNDDDLTRFSHDRNRLSEDGMSDCDTERNSPITPVEYHAISSDVAQKPPCHRKTWSGAMFAGEREMTLHLTLTRPDLDRGYPYSARNDPLKLDALPTMRDHEAAKGFSTGPGSSDAGKVRGLWRKLKTMKS